MPNITAIQKAQLEFIQKNFRKFRLICEWTANDVAEVLGITRQTVNNIELGKTKLSPLQYIAFVSMLEHRKQCTPEIVAYFDVCLTQFPRNDQKASFNLLSSWFDLFPKQFQKSDISENAARNIQSISLMENIVSKCKIIVTPDIFHDNQRCLDELCTLALQYDNPLIVPAKAYVVSLALMSDESKALVDGYEREGKIRFYGNENDGSLEDVITSQILRLRSKYPLCLITNNRILASDAQALGTIQSVSGFCVVTAHVVDGVYLEPWGGDTDSIISLIKSADCPLRKELVDNQHDINSTEINISDKTSNDDGIIQKQYCSSQVNKIDDMDNTFKLWISDNNNIDNSWHNL